MTIARDTVMGEEPVYGIATGNRFAMVEIGDDIDDPSEFYTLIEKEKAEKKKADKKKKEKKLEKKKEDEKKPEPKKEEDTKDNNNNRGRGRGRGRGNRGRGNNDNRRFNRGDDESLPPRLQDGEERPEGGDDGQEKRRGGGGYRGRGGNNRRGRGNYRGRQYDRHSGSDRSGVKAQDKRDGGGSHNWGSPTDDTPQDWGVTTEKDETSQENKEPSGFDNIEQPSGFDNIEGAADQSGEGGEAGETADDGPEQITYEEYQAKIAEEKKGKQAFNIRKAGENEDDSQWKNFAPLKKESKDTYMGGNDEYEKIIVRGGRKKNLVDLDVKFSTPTRRGGNRTRDRGRDRRGDHNQGKESGTASLNLENQKEFPTLS